MTALPGREGLQPERTALAWQRCAITATVVIVPLIVVSVRLGLWLMTVLECAATVSAVVLVVAVRRRFGQLLDQDIPDIPVSPFIPMVGVAAVIGAAAVVGLATALVVFGS